MASDMDNMDTDVVAGGGSLSRDGIQAGSDDNAGDVAYRHGVDGVNDARAARQLDATLEHANEEVVIVTDTSGSVTEDVARSDDRSEEATSASLADELFRYLEFVRISITYRKGRVGSYSPTWSGRNQCQGQRGCPSCRPLP